jgi:hypothetical protein
VMGPAAKSISVFQHLHHHHHAVVRPRCNNRHLCRSQSGSDYTLLLYTDPPHGSHRRRQRWRARWQPSAASPQSLSIMKTNKEVLVLKRTGTNPGLVSGVRRRAWLSHGPPDSEEFAARKGELRRGWGRALFDSVWLNWIELG